MHHIQKVFSSLNRGQMVGTTSLQKGAGRHETGEMQTVEESLRVQIEKAKV